MKYLFYIAIIVSLGLALSSCSKNSHDGHKGHNAEQASKKNKYRCPMHPQITSDKPGSCPICGMDLVLNEALEEEDHSAHTKNPESNKHTGHTGMNHPEAHAKVKLSEHKKQMIGIKTAKVQIRKLFKSISAPGRIAFDPELYTVQSEYIEALKQWKKVKKSPIKEVRDNTKEMIKSSRIRLKVLGLSDKQIRAIAKKGRLSEGLLIAKHNESWVYADIFEVDLPYIQEGLSVKITANFLQGKTLYGKVVSVDRVIEPKTRTAKVRIKLAKGNISIRPESYVNVTIYSPLGKKLSVPIEAIVNTGKETFVFVKKDNGIFHPLNVNLILESDKYAAIQGDLEEGDEVVVGGNFMLDSESRLQAVLNSGSGGSGGHHHHH